VRAWSHLSCIPGRATLTTASTNESVTAVHYAKKLVFLPELVHNAFEKMLRRHVVHVGKGA